MPLAKFPVERKALATNSPRVTSRMSAFSSGVYHRDLLRLFGLSSATSFCRYVLPTLAPELAVAARSSAYWLVSLTVWLCLAGAPVAAGLVEQRGDLCPLGVGAANHARRILHIAIQPADEPARRLARRRR